MGRIASTGRLSAIYMEKIVMFHSNTLSRNKIYQMLRKGLKNMEDNLPYISFSQEFEIQNT